MSPTAPPFFTLKPIPGRNSVWLVFSEQVFLVMRDLYHGSRDRGGERDRVMKRLTLAWGADGDRSVYSLRLTARSAESVGRFLSTVAWEVGHLQRAMQPYVEERHRFDFDRELKKTRDWLTRFAHHTLDVVDKLALLAPTDSTSK